MAAPSLATRIKERLVIKTPRFLDESKLRSVSQQRTQRKEMTEAELLRIVKRGEKEYKAGKTKVARSVMDLLGS